MGGFVMAELAEVFCNKLLHDLNVCRNEFNSLGQ
jgi:hypothetical protein